MKTIKWWTTLDLMHCYCCVIETKTKRIILVNHNRRTNQITKQIQNITIKPSSRFEEKISSGFNPALILSHSSIKKSEEVKYCEKTISAPDMGLEPMTLRLKV